MEEQSRQQWLEAANQEWARILQEPLARAELEAEQMLWDAENDPWEPLPAEEQSE